MPKCKYKKKYAQELKDGLRRYPDISPNGREYGWSIERICARWGITEKTYHNWRAEFKSFDEACEIGERDFKLYWLDKIEDGVNQGKAANGSLLKLVAANVLGWSDKKEVKHENEDNKITAINITMLAPPEKQPQLPQPDNIIDITDVKNNKS